MLALLLIWAAVINLAESAQRIAVAPHNTTVRLGESTLLKCRVENQKGAVQWTRDGFGLGTDRDIKLFDRFQMVGSANIGEFHLQIRNVTLDDDGPYECQLLGADEENTAQITEPAYLTVLAEPRGPFLTVNRAKPDKLNTVEDKEVDVECVVTQARPAAKIVWVLAMDVKGQRVTTFLGDAATVLRENGFSTVRHQNVSDQFVTNAVEEDDDLFMTTTSVLRYRPSRYHDKRYLTCMALHETFGSHARSASTYLNVQYKPKVEVVLDQKQSDLREGGRAVFKCNVEAKPPPTRVFWGKYGDRLKELNSKTAIIDNLSMDDHLNAVSCFAENSVGPGKGVTNISISYGPKMVSKSTKQTVRVGESVTFQCEAAGNPEPTVLWFRKGERTSYEPMAKGPNLTLLSVDRWHVGEYECMAQSKGFPPARLMHYLKMEGELLWSARKVRSGPPMVKVAEAVHHRQSIQLRCVIRSEPLPNKIEWFVNGRKLDYEASRGRVVLDEVRQEYGVESKLTINQAVHSDYGNYNCTAINDLGVGSSDTTVVEQTVLERTKKTLLSIMMTVPWYVWSSVLAFLCMLLFVCLIWRCCCCCGRCRGSESIKPTKFSDCSDVTVRCEALDEDAQEYFTNMFPSPHSDSEMLRKDYVSVPQSNPDLDYLPPPVYGSYYQGAYDYSNPAIQLEQAGYGTYSHSPALASSEVCVGVYPNRGNVSVRQLNVAPLDTLPEIRTPEPVQRVASRLSTHV